MSGVKPEMKCIMLEERDGPIMNKSPSQCMLGAPAQLTKALNYYLQDRNDN